MAPAPIRIFGYAIISVEGIIADANGRMPVALIIDSDHSFFQASLARAQAVVHGRNSAEGGPTADQRHRVILTNTIDAVSCVSSSPRVLLWNPNGGSFAQVLESLPLEEGIIAIIGGTAVFDLFLTIGYDAFFLSRAVHAHVRGGRPVFSKIPGQSPQQILTDHGLFLRREQNLDDKVTLEEWTREQNPLSGFSSKPGS